MKKTLLFIDACQRGDDISRTYHLCDAFLRELRINKPDIIVEHVKLRELDLKPYDGQRVLHREALIDNGQFDHPDFGLARSFNQADYLLIGAPYWDLSFPAVLKTYIENIFVRNLNFRYTPEGEPLGLAHGKKAVYITTSGSPIGLEDWGAGYIKAVVSMLGIPRFERVSAEGIDIQSWDKEGILQKAREEAIQAARRLTE